MIQCADVAVRYGERMRQYYIRIRRRHGHAIAVTRVANKMIRAVWRMLTDRIPHNGRNEQLYQKKIEIGIHIGDGMPEAERNESPSTDVNMGA